SGPHKSTAARVGGVFIRGTGRTRIPDLIIDRGICGGRLDLDKRGAGLFSVAQRNRAMSSAALSRFGAGLLNRLSAVAYPQQLVGPRLLDLALGLDDLLPIVRPRLLDGGDVLADGALIFVNLALGVCELGDQRVDRVAVFGHARRKGFAAHDARSRDACHARLFAMVTPTRRVDMRVTRGPSGDAIRRRPVRKLMLFSAHHSRTLKTRKSSRTAGRLASMLPIRGSFKSKKNALCAGGAEAGMAKSSFLFGCRRHSDGTSWCQVAPTCTDWKLSTRRSPLSINARM